MPTRKLVLGVSALSALTLLATGCSSGSDSSASGPKTITIWSSMDQPIIDGLKAKLNPRAKAQGITVQWRRVDNINQIIVQKVQANDAPDIALLPQPGIIKDFAAKGKVTALDDVLDLPALQKSMTAGTLDVAKVNGKTYGLMVSMNVKGLVFYPKKAFEAAGYTAPKTLDELNTLTTKIKADGKTPWCLGIESGTATGWPATDWFENLVLKYGGIDKYNEWISHKTKFDSPLIRQAAAQFQKIAFTDGNVLGGRKSIASNAFGTAGNAMFKSKPGCYMYQQGSFITGFFPKSVQKNLDSEVGVFGLPPATAGGENPVEGGGDTASIYKDSPAARKVMKLLAATDLGTTAASNGSSFISPHKDFPLGGYPLKTTQSIAKVAYDSTGFAFDASDAMPAAVGSGTFWKEMTAWISGQESLDDALKNIDASWPAS
ncbi:ABC transporter substrate-binding protein [Streptomyces himalayensis]|uniref:Extracellular solute-binding protein n=1 Tax=Streptomyces himalayensis subsp. himalayensis TaxID=2756131 RepID=A0A7W0DTR6_9ACTN|nr:extracellular solute-binding protein [Streptomyces himalayensis]MBA2951097.1 extracellular solute-binding protein [Streptomyces himalayensis subsp. himalayensis]